MYKFVILFVAFSAVVAVTLADRKQDILFGEYGSLGTKTDFYSEEYLNGNYTKIKYSEIS